MSRRKVSEAGEEPWDIRERAFELAVRVVRLCEVLDGEPGVSRTLAGQLLRSGTSVGANIEEAKAGQSKADFVAKMSIASKEARETHYWLRLLKAGGLIESGKLESLLAEKDEVVAVLTAIVKKARERE
ncbi:MAG: four helix bundle protein [Verrucomicrobiota bacterium]